MQVNGDIMFHGHLLCQFIMLQEQTTLFHLLSHNFPGLSVASTCTDSVKPTSGSKVFITVHIYCIAMENNFKKFYINGLQVLRHL